MKRRPLRRLSGCRQLLLPGTGTAPVHPAVLDVEPLPTPAEGRQSHVRALLRLRLSDGREVPHCRLAEVRGRLTVFPPQLVHYDPRTERLSYRTPQPWSAPEQPLIDAAARAAWSAACAAVRQQERETGGRPA